MNQKFTQLRNNDLIVSQTIKDRMAMYQIDSYGQNEKIVPIGTQKLHYDLSRGHKPTILLIDDEKEFPYKLSKCLQWSLLLTVNDISVATRLLKDTMPDLIVVNMMTTGVSGFDFVRNVKRNKHTMQIPFVMLSANASTDEQIRGLKCGVNMYLPIPCELNYLSVVINSLLEQKQMLKEFYTTSASTYSYSYGHLISAEDRNFIAKVTEIVDQNMDDSDFNTNKLAELMGLSRRSLYRKFGSAKLPSVNLFIREYRIQAAAKLLCTTLLTVSEVMYKTGFETRSLFYSEFRKHFHTTPKAYRQQHLVKDETL